MYFHSVLLIFILAFLSHFILDIIPHWGLEFDRNHFKINSQISFTKKTATFFILDILIALILLGIIFFSFGSELMVLGGLVSVLPDIMSIGYLTKLKHKKHYNKFLHFHNNIQKDAGFFLGLITQLIITVILLIFIF